MGGCVEQLNQLLMQKREKERGQWGDEAKGKERAQREGGRLSLLKYLLDKQVLFL